VIGLSRRVNHEASRNDDSFRGHREHSSQSCAARVTPIFEMGKRPVIVTCLVLAFGCSLCFATTAVVFVDKDRILIGTDSLWRGWSGRTLRTGTVCKIDTERPNCIFAVVGFVQERKTGFNPNQYARSACAAHLSLLETAQRFGEIAKRPLERAIEYSRLNTPDGYKYLRGKAVLNGIFCRV
jgi:hypothetical protein